MPKAIQYGMTPEQFYNNNIDLFYAYEKAYITKIHNESHIQGMYIHTALEIALANSLGRSKGQKAYEYPKTAVYSPYDENYLKKKEILNMDSKEKNNYINKKKNYWSTLFQKKKEGGNTNG